MKAIFSTNLDEAKRDVFALNERVRTSGMGLVHVPRVGERIIFEFERGGTKRYELEVCAVSYHYADNVAEVELHIPSYHRTSISDWSEYMRRHREGRP